MFLNASIFLSFDVFTSCQESSTASARIITSFAKQSEGFGGVKRLAAAVTVSSSIGRIVNSFRTIVKRSLSCSDLPNYVWHSTLGLFLLGHLPLISLQESSSNFHYQPGDLNSHWQNHSFCESQSMLSLSRWNSHIFTCILMWQVLLNMSFAAHLLHPLELFWRAGLQLFLLQLFLIVPERYLYSFSLPANDSFSLHLMWLQLQPLDFCNMHPRISTSPRLFQETMQKCTQQVRVTKTLPAPEGILNGPMSNQ